jgi:hypothetical protein
MYKDYYIKDGEIIFTSEDGTMQVAKYNDNLVSLLEAQNEYENTLNKLDIISKEKKQINDLINQKDDEVYRVKGLGAPVCSIIILMIFALFNTTSIVLAPFAILSIITTLLAFYNEMKRENKLRCEMITLEDNLEELQKEAKFLEQEKSLKLRSLKELKLQNLRYSKNNKEIKHLTKKEELTLFKKELESVNTIENLNSDYLEKEESITRKRVLN